jgi:hypothetical protein
VCFCVLVPTWTGAGLDMKHFDTGMFHGMFVYRYYSSPDLDGSRAPKMKHRPHRTHIRSRNANPNPNPNPGTATQTPQVTIVWVCMTKQS